MPRFYDINTVLDIPMLGNDDLLKRSKGRLLKWSKFVWDDMNEDTLRIAERVRIPIRQQFWINKRTNSIDMPCDFLKICSVNVIDCYGQFIPVFLNDRLHDDIVDVGGTKDCACEYNCGYRLCNTIKGYEAITTTKSDKLPTGEPISFTCVDRKYIDPQGFLYSETQYPLRVYLSGVWTDTVLHTESTKMCAVELDKNGCCCDTEENVNNVCDACGINTCSIDNPVPFGGTSDIPPAKGVTTWQYYCNSKLDWFSYQCGCPTGKQGGGLGCSSNIYNISELGNRLIFPHNFGWDRVMVRFYPDIQTSELQIPYMAVETFVMGLKFWDVRFDDKKQDLAEVYGQHYSRLKWGLFLELNKHRIAEQKMILTPPIYVPSFISHRRDGYATGNYYGNGNENY